MQDQFDYDQEMCTNMIDLYIDIAQIYTDMAWQKQNELFGLLVRGQETIYTLMNLCAKLGVEESEYKRQQLHNIEQKRMTLP